VGDEHVEAAELIAHAAEEAFDLGRLRDVGLNDESVRAGRPDLFERRLRRRFVLQIVDGDMNPLLRKLQSDAAAYAARAAGHERISGSDRHGSSFDYNRRVVGGMVPPRAPGVFKPASIA